MTSFQRTFGFIHRHPLAKHHLWRAYMRFFTWQIKSRLMHGLLKVRFIGQTYFLAKRQLTGVTGNIYAGLHDFADMGFLLHLLRENDIFYDVGANVGSYTLLASSQCGSKSISFEPVPSTFELLQKNVHLNHIEHLVTLENQGVGKSSGKLCFTASDDTTNHVVQQNENQNDTIEVNIISLDEYTLGKKTPILLKIDVEGFETEVISGANKLLANPDLKAIIIELIGGGIRYGFNENNIWDTLQSHSFKAYNYDAFARKLQEVNIKENNVIFIRDNDFIEQRLKNAKAFRIFGEEI